VSPVGGSPGWFGAVSARLQASVRHVGLHSVRSPRASRQTTTPSRSWVRPR
jgi:hypothetical protein